MATTAEAVRSQATTAGTDVVDDTKASLGEFVRAQFQGAYQIHRARASAEAAAPMDWWDMYLFGPIQPSAQGMPPASIGDTLLPHRIVRVGEPVYFTTVLFLNPNFPGSPSPANLLSHMGCPYEINYYSGSLKNWAPAGLQQTVTGQFSPNQTLYIDVVEFIPQKPDLIEINVTGTVMNCNNAPLPSFGGFASAVYQFDSGIFDAGNGFRYDKGSRFLVTE